MIEYYVVKTGKPIRIGDTYEDVEVKEFSFGSIKKSIKATLTGELLKQLITENKIKVRAVKDAKYNKPLSFFIASGAQKLDVTTEEFAELLDTLNEHYSLAVINILLKEISLYLNSLPQEKITNLVYFISSNDCSIHCAPKSEFKHNASTFNSREDAEYAASLLNTQFNFMNGKQED